MRKIIDLSKYAEPPEETGVAHERPLIAGVFHNRERIRIFNYTHAWLAWAALF